MKPRLGVGVFTLAASAVLVACTTFNGLVAQKEGSDAGTGAHAGDAAATVDGDAGADSNDSSLGPVQFLPLEEAVRVCAKIIQCHNIELSIPYTLDIPTDRSNFSYCVHWLAGPLPPDRVGVGEVSAVLHCAAVADSCTTAGVCFGIERIDPATDPRCAVVDGGRGCAEDGGAAYFCNAKRPQVDHCSASYYALGSTCVEDPVRGPDCYRDPCGSDSCDGNVYMFCGSGATLHASRNCALFGMTCGPTSATGRECLSPGVQYGTATTGGRCIGEDAVYDDSTYVSVYRCPTLGGACKAQDAGLIYCSLPTDACTAFDSDINQCTGNTIALCIGGQKTSFDCSTAGLACVNATADLSGHCE